MCESIHFSLEDEVGITCKKNLVLLPIPLHPEVTATKVYQCCRVGTTGQHGSCQYGASAAATSECLAATTFPDTHPKLTAADDLYELHVGTLGEEPMMFNPGPDKRQV